MDRNLFEFYLMFLSREIDIKLCQRYTKTHIWEMWFKNEVLTDHIQQIRNKFKSYDNPEEPKQLR